MPTFHTQPLRRQIIFATVSLLLLLGVGVFWSAMRTANERRAEVRAEAAAMTTMGAAYLDRYLDGIDAAASVLTRNPSVTALDRVQCDRLFSTLLHEEPLIINLVLTDTKGAVRGTGLVFPPAIDQTVLMPYVAAVVKSGRPVIGDLWSGQISGKPVVVLAYPVRNESGALVGTLGFGLDLAGLQTVFAGIPLPVDSVVTLADAQGRILTRSRDAERYIGQTADMGPMPTAGAPRVEPHTSPDGVDRYYGDTLIARGPWRFSVGIPRNEVYLRLRSLWFRNLAIVLSAIAAMLFLSLWLSHSISRELGVMQSAARRIAEGDLSPPPVRRAPNLEIAQLQDAFRTMATSLRDMRDALDGRVEQERKMRETLQSLQRQVVRQERLAAVGVLVSGVAHELNNPLQAILGAAELIEQRTELGPEARVEIDLLKTQSSRARDIIRNLSRFSSQHAGPPEPVDLRDVIAEVVQLRRRDLEKSSIALDVEMRSNRKVFANFTELEQVTLNFVINAQQSIEGSGRLKGRILIRLFDDGKRVRLEVQDDGPGVTGTDEPKLFQPFFTTKAVGQGTGLGLSVSYGIIDSYGGAIGHTANEWGGATFFFFLAAVDQAADDTSAILVQTRTPTA